MILLPLPMEAGLRTLEDVLDKNSALTASALCVFKKSKPALPDVIQYLLSFFTQMHILNGNLVTTSIQLISEDNLTFPESQKSLSDLRPLIVALFFE